MLESPLGLAAAPEAAVRAPGLLLRIRNRSDEGPKGVGTRSRGGSGAGLRLEVLPAERPDTMGVIVSQRASRTDPFNSKVPPELNRQAVS